MKDFRDSQGRTPLHEAAGAEEHELVKVLLDHGADIEAQDNYGETPLHLAAGNNATEATKVLLEHGAETGSQQQLLP